MFAARCKARGVPPYLQFLHLVADTDWSQCRLPRSDRATWCYSSGPRLLSSSPLSGTAPSILTIFRLELWAIFFNSLIPPIIPILQFLSYFPHCVHERNSRLLLRHFREVTPRHGNQVVANDCCAGDHLGDTIMQSIPYIIIIHFLSPSFIRADKG